jgi:hypothetical protein
MTRDTLLRRAVSLRPVSIFGYARPSQQEVRKDKLAFTSGKWAAAGAASYLAMSGFRTGFGFDDLI